MTTDWGDALAQAVQGFAATAGMASVLWTALTLAVYTVTMGLYRRSGAHPLMLPVVTGTAVIVLLLLATRTPYEDYLQAVQPLLFLVGPATVALAVPLYGQMARLKRIWWPVTVALLVGGTVALVSALLIGWAFGASDAMLLSLAPKSSTMPVAISVTQQFGGVASLAAVAVAITGIVGTMLSGPLLRWLLGARDDVVHGFALGLAAHAIGTARALQISETAGAFAAMAMGLNGLFTALLMPLAAAWVASGA